MRKPQILVVDDDALYRQALERVFHRTGHTVRLARDASEAMEIVTAEPIDLVFTDVQMPGPSGLELVRRIHEHDPDIPCIVMTGYASAEGSIEALRAGAYWFLEKPFEGARLDSVRKLALQALDHGRLRSENRKLQRELRTRHKFDAIVGKSARLARTLALVEKVADTDSTVLITGESGTGKELFARALHYNSGRADRPLVTVNCGAIPEALLESELFGHVKGAFTNAHAHREGRFAAAHGGTIFLDEIGDMSPNLQVKLLRVLQERSFEPVGASTTRHVDVRVIAATHRNLPERIAEGRFREDLFYRLNVLPIEVPPLRERIEDLPLLVHHFLDHAQKERGSRVTGFSDDALQRLMDHDWPGNVRELENLIERLTVLVGEGEIDVPDLPDSIRAEPALRTWAPRVPSTGLDFNDVVTRFENDLIQQALEQTGWNKNRAAQRLRLNRTTLLEKIKKRGLVPRRSLL
ncbi:MAG: sigma-54-dependent Fis family transcriptional regulator [Deltaproteobacteria bacterium]|nr:sigma-54-dependent Fis family transcriptional regulator [Deltaproteobacteria bacterium]